jgi:vacuolar-type H+-ATPase subunit H
MQRHEVAEILDNRYVKKYIDNVMQEAGFRQMNKLEEIMNELIEKKMQELAEAEVGSSKDIADLLALANKMANDKAKLLHEKAKEEKVLLQKNTQFNIYDSASSYGKLMEAIASGKDI